MSKLKIELPKNFPFETQIAVRITDLNYGGHLGNDTYLTIIHEARVQFLNNYGFSETDIDGVGIIMNEAEIKFKGEVFYGSHLVVKVAVTNLKMFSCDFYYVFIDNKSGKEVCHARTGAVFFDYTTRNISETPEIFKTKFQ